MSVETTLYRVYNEELAGLLNVLLAGHVVRDETVNRQLVESITALIELQQRHWLDENGKCAVCWHP